MSSLALSSAQQQNNPRSDLGGTLLCLNVPSKIYFGIDYLTFETGVKFKGVRRIPSGGPHFIHTSIHNAERMGFFVWLDDGQIDIFQWDKSLQFLTNLEDSEQGQRLRIAVRNHEFDSNLGQYPNGTVSKWTKLCNHITAPLIRRLGPKSEMMTSSHCEINGVSNGNRKEDQEMKDINDGDNDGVNAKYLHYHDQKLKYSQYRPSYTKIPQISSMTGLSPSEMTTLQMDRSKILYDLLNGPFKENHFALIGELQYAFISLLVGQTVQGLEQWKVIIDLICNCCDAVEEKQEFYTEFIGALIVQLGELPRDFFRDQLTNKSFLNQSLQSLMEIANESVIGSDLKAKVNALKEILSERFDKTFDLHADGPVIVAL